MKNLILILGFACLISASSVFAAEDELVPPIVPNDSRAAGRLVDTDISSLKSKVNDLERRLNDLDRDKRFSEDRVRQLERDVNDMRRRIRSLP